MTNSGPLHSAADDGFAPHWWARGLTLRERLAAGAATAAPAAAAPDRDAWRRRLRTLDPDGALALRLEDLALEDDVLAAVAVEPPARLARRSTTPPWARFVAEAVSRAPQHPPVPATHTDWRAAFAEVFAPLVDAAGHHLPTAAPSSGGEAPAHLDAARLHGHVTERLGRRLADPAARTLVTELHRQREAGTLHGADPRARFADFCRRTGTRAGLTRLFTDHPVLARLLGQLCLQTAGAATEVLERYHSDRKDLVTMLFRGSDPGTLVDIDFGHGDTHDGGRSVAKLHFRDGRRLVYKPRSTAQHQPLARMVDWLNRAVPGLELRTLSTLSRPGYGWAEHVEHLPCAEPADVDRFYRRQGALLALLHAVEGVDMHCENLIACGDQPVLVDVETLLHPSVPPATTAGADPAAATFAASVHRTCVLPHPMFGESGALDVSALGGSGGGAYPTDSVTWDGTCTDTMHLVRRSQPYSGADNRPRCGGADADPGAYEAALLSGFRAGYDAITEHRDELLAPDGPLRACGEAQVRLIARPTRLYGTLLEESTHPELLQDALHRDAVLAALHQESEADPLRTRLVEAEIADLWQGDVPLFRHRPDQRHVWTCDGRQLTDALARSGMRSAEDKIRAMSEVGRHQQEWLISASLAVHRGRPVEHRSPAPAPPAPPAAAADEGRLLAAACGIADEIVGRVVHRGDRANWLGMELVDGVHWSVLPMGAGLAEGYTGTALFLAQLGELTGVRRYTELATDALRGLPLLARALARDPRLAQAVGVGGFHGLGGLCYSLARLGTLLGDTARTGLTDALTALAAAGNDLDGGDPRETGVCGGTAGALAAALAVHRETGLPQASALADDLAPRLLAALAAPPTDGATAADTGCRTSAHGFADGLAGAGWALGRYAAQGPGREQYATAARDTTRRAHAAGSGTRDDHSWCSGTAGLHLSALEAPVHSTAPAPGTAHWLRRLAEQPVGRDLSLCHGELGVLEALHALRKRGDADADRLFTHRLGAVLGSLDQGGPRCGTPEGMHTPGLLSGLAGIGYGLLRFGAEQQVPSVLLLHATHDCPHPADSPLPAEARPAAHPAHATAGTPLS
ncbi:type 2 lanthipeptide synthetase LanM family protein [Streptomyces sp. TR02-1]|uniref:type 2 lanthipeptide synthetase LanM family protein n=1 Tax=Streptomyces sp. TR02-1 TaxID=3385977 RepID=UPI00399F90BD